MTRPTTRFKGDATGTPTLPLPSPQNPVLARVNPTLGPSKPLVPGLGPATLPAPLFHSFASGPFHCKVYLEWGSQYDVRELLLVFWQSKYSYEDHTGSVHLTLHDYLSEHDSLEAAKSELENLVFSIGEERTFIDYGSEQVWKPQV